MDKLDYEEPRCPFDCSMWKDEQLVSIPTARVLAKEDEYLAKDDPASALQLLQYWWQEAEQGRDERGKLLLSNEMMGLYRKQGKGEQAKTYAMKALELVKTLGLEDSIGGATAFLNAGTVYKAFGEAERSLLYFEKARKVYEAELDAKDARKAGLYNNMALTLVDLGRYDEARKLYHRAIDIVRGQQPAEEAITWLNLADCETAEKGSGNAETEIYGALDRAEALLDAVAAEARDGAYAFVCEKCAPCFDYHGYFMTAEKLRKRSAEIYANNSKKR